MEKQQTVNVLYAGNYKIFDGLLISLLSMVKHTKTPLNVMCLTMDLHELDPRFIPMNKDHEKYINKVLKDVNKDSSFKIIDATEVFKENLINSVNIGSHFTPYSMLRLLADKIEGMPEKFIYLDTDTIINNDINQLFDIDVTDYEMAVVKDAFIIPDPTRWGRKYFNAGVLLVNLTKVKETGMFERAVIMCRDRKMLYMDQEALNCVCKKKLMLPVKFNSKDKYYKEIVVHHFCNVRRTWNWFHRIKPWHVEDVKKKMSAYNDILDDFLARKAQPDYPKVEQPQQ